MSAQVPDRWQFVKHVFGAAQSLTPPARAAFLASVCGNDHALNSELSHLLNAHDKAGASFLDSPLVQSLVTWSGDESETRHGDDVSRAVSPVGGRISHYAIEADIGAGGMGTVYRAWDVALGRPAAVKLLSSRFTATLQERLRHEAESCARLQHPAIATFFESGDLVDGTFIAMELVDGDTLRARLHNGPVPVADAVAMAGCVLEALSHAHSVGILHRDIKPENIMVTGPRSAKLLDFGLAKDLVPADPSLTMMDNVPVGSIVGTVGYMSPEQIVGGALDARTDLFQVGAVLYEALTGRPAFPGDTVIERLSAVLSRDPNAMDPGIPTAVASIVLRALNREPAERYPSASAFLLDLQRAMDGESVGDLALGIAVVDFENATGDAAHAWIGTGMAETIGADLARVSPLRVVPRERVSAARGQTAQQESHDATLGSVLGCRWVLAGRYFRLGDALRVTMRVIEAPTGRAVATETCDGVVSRIFDVHDQIVKRTLAALALEADTPPAPRPGISSYELYARGRRLFLRLEKGSMDQAGSYYEQAVEADAGNAAARSGLAGFHAMRFTFTTDSTALRVAADLATRAIAADSTRADARNWLGYALWRLGDYDASATELARALQPTWFFPWYFGAAVEIVRGRPDDALILAQRAVALEPQQSFPMWFLACLHADAGRYAEALWCFDRSEVIEHAGAGSAQWAGLAGYHAECLRRVGRLDTARTTCLDAIEEVERSDHMYRDSHRAVCLVTLGRIALQQTDREAAEAAFRQALAHIKGRDRTLAGGFLAVQALAGLAQADRDAEAFAEAGRLYAERDRFDFSWLHFCWDDVTLLSLARAATALGRHDEAAHLRTRAQAAGSFEAREPLP